MAPVIKSTVDDMRRLLDEEAHLIGQEVQDSLGRDELHRLHELSAALNELSERFANRRPH